MTFIRPAPKELAILAAAMRGWDYDEIRAAILGASQAGWSDDRIYREVFRLLLLEDASPADLRAAARSVGQGPGDYQRGLAAARQALEGHPGPVAREGAP